MSQEQDPLLNSLKDKIFSEVKGDIFIGDEKIKPELREVLKEQAKYLSSSQLYEILVNTLVQESSDLALKQSTEWNHVLYAKALKYWSDVMVSMVNKLKA